MKAYDGLRVYLLFLITFASGMRKRLIFSEAEVQPNKSTASIFFKEVKPNRQLFNR